MNVLVVRVDPETLKQPEGCTCWWQDALTWFPSDDCPVHRPTGFGFTNTEVVSGGAFFDTEATP